MWPIFQSVSSLFFIFSSFSGSPFWSFDTRIILIPQRLEVKLCAGELFLVRARRKAGHRADSFGIRSFRPEVSSNKCPNGE